MSNTNGNTTLFLTSLWTAAAPNYMLYRGSNMATTVFFYYLLAFYGMVFFTNHLTVFPDERKNQVKHATNHNETHYASVVLGVLLGLASRGRLRK